MAASPARAAPAALGGSGLEHDAPRPGDVRRLCADSTRAARLLGYVPTVSVEEGLRRTLAWYRSLGVTPERLLADEVVRAWEGDAEAAPPCGDRGPGATRGE